MLAVLVFAVGAAAQQQAVPPYVRHARRWATRRRCRGPVNPTPRPRLSVVRRRAVRRRCRASRRLRRERCRRGPMHEAFAQPAESIRKPGLIIPKAPPEPVDELPPDQRPEGANVAWIPGYWGWDEDRADFLWVSGVWRVMPSGRKWVPGYWNPTDAGFQWVSGFWARNSADELSYIEPPPESLEPRTFRACPANRQFLRPRCLAAPRRALSVASGLLRRRPPGPSVCLPALRLDAARHAVCPRLLGLPAGESGSAVRAGLFPPDAASAVRLEISAALDDRGTGSFTVAVGSARARLLRFWRLLRRTPTSRRGYSPWISYGPRYRDPLFSYYRWANRDNPGWQSGLASAYRNRVGGNLALPPRTLAVQQRLATTSRASGGEMHLVRHLSDVRGSSLRIAKVTAAKRATSARLAASYRNASVARGRYETSAVRSSTTRTTYMRQVPRGTPRIVARGTTRVARPTSTTRTAARKVAPARRVASSGKAATSKRSTTVRRKSASVRTAPRRSASPGHPAAPRDGVRK